MRVQGALGHRARQVLLVVGAEQPPAGAVVERVVEQQLVQLALDELGGAPTGEGGFADAAQPPSRAGVPVEDVGPHPDDPRGVGPDLGHVEELDVRRVAAERVAEQVQPGAGLGDHDGLVALEPLADERQQAGQEVRVPAVEHRLVLEAVLGHHGGHASDPVNVTGATRAEVEELPHPAQERRRAGDLQRHRPLAAGPRPTGRGPGTRRRPRTPGRRGPGRRRRRGSAPAARTRASRSPLNASTLPARAIRSPSTKSRNEDTSPGAPHERVHGRDVGERLAGEVGPVGAHRREARAAARRTRRPRCSHRTRSSRRAGSAARSLTSASTRSPRYPSSFARRVAAS